MKLICILSIIGFVLLLGFNVSCHRPDLPYKVKSHNILKISLGMPLDKVMLILGRPLEVEALRGIHDIGCKKPNAMFNEKIDENTDIKHSLATFLASIKYCCEVNKEDIQKLDRITLVYTKEGSFASYPMLWVHLDTTYRVNNIYAKKYDFFDDAAIYQCSWSMDSSYTKVNYNKIERNIDEKHFYHCFK